MALGAIARGYDYFAITDHSHYLRDGRLAAQDEEVAALNERLAPFRILSGVEANIRADGSIDLSEEELALARLGDGVAPPSFDKAPTERVLAAMEHPYVDCIGHLTARKLNKRAPADIDSGACSSKRSRPGRFLEINGQPDRLDLRDVARPRGRRGGREDRALERRAFDCCARLPRSGARAGAPRLADEGAGREHAPVGAAREAEEEAVRLPRGRRGRTRLGGAVPRGGR